MVRRTENYFRTAKEYREKLAAIWAEYEQEQARLEKYQGSAGYAEELKELESKRKEAIKATQAEYATRFNGIIYGMRNSAKGASMETPTAEQINLLTVLKMREKITADELQQAGRTLKDSPVCLSVLDEIAEKMELHGLHFSAESTKSVLEHIDTLEDSARRLCKLDKPNSRADMAARASVHSPNYDHNAFYSFRVDKDVSTENEAMALYGCVDDFPSFALAVNR